MPVTMRQMIPKWKTEISIGNLLAIFSVVGGFVTLYVSMQVGIDETKIKVSLIERAQEIVAKDMKDLQASNLRIATDTRDKIDQIYIMLLSRKASLNGD